MTLVLTCQPPCYSNAAYGNALHFSPGEKGRGAYEGLVEKRAVVTFAFTSPRSARSVGLYRLEPRVYSPNWRESARTAACHANDSLRMHESKGTERTDSRACAARAHNTTFHAGVEKFVKTWPICPKQRNFVVVSSPFHETLARDTREVKGTLTG